MKPLKVRHLALLFMCILSFTLLTAFAPQDSDGDKGRFVVERIMQGVNMKIDNEKGAGILMFTYSEEDSLRFSCKSCYKLLEGDSKTKSKMQLYLKNGDEKRALGWNDFNTWVDAGEGAGMVSLVIEFSGRKSEELTLPNLRIFRKTREETSAAKMGHEEDFEFKNLYFERLILN